MAKISWFYESASERKENNTEVPKASFGAYQKEGTVTFDEHYNKLQKQYKESHSVDIKKDIGAMLSDRQFMESFKTDLMAPVIEGFLESSPNDPHIQHIVENVQKFWDTKVKNYTESASMTGFLPIATLEFPVLLKQFFQSILKDIIEVETTKTPNLTKHVRTTFMVDNNTGEEYEYPRCMFDGTWQKIYNATKGHKIREEVVPLDNGRLWKYDIVKNLTEGVPGLDQLSFNLQIIGIKIADETIKIKGNGITIEFSTNGTFVNGDLKFTSEKGTEVEDTISGRVNFKTGTVDLSSASGQIEGVIFSGYLSNEKNMRHASVREKRDIMRFTIEDGQRWNMPFSIEEIEDAAALLDLNYYNRMVDEIVKCQEMNEGMTVIQFLNDEFKKYQGTTPNIYKLESMANVYHVDINTPYGFAGDPFKFITTAIQFRLKAIINQITELTKMEGLSFIIVGNPMATSLLSEFVQWKSQSGASIGGITVNNSYGFATDLGGNVRTVATNLYDAYTENAVQHPVKAGEPQVSQRELILHIYGYPTDAEHISFRHLKYTSHLLTSQSQTAYQSPAAPGGAYNIVTATSRFKTIAVQGIQAQLIILNSDKVYGPAPVRPPIVGGPSW
jgi:hypothetical protein